MTKPWFKLVPNKPHKLNARGRRWLRRLAKKLANKYPKDFFIAGFVDLQINGHAAVKLEE